MGLFGGAAGAELLNGAHAVEQVAVELPILDKRIRTERRGTHPEVRTIAPTLVLRPDWQSVDRATVYRAQPGQCLRVRRLTGWLGGEWLDDRKMLAACAPRRGPAGPAILAMEGAPQGWRWHRPAPLRMQGAAIAIDTALPADLRCRLDPDLSWLYRCEVRSGRGPAR